MLEPYYIIQCEPLAFDAQGMRTNLRNFFLMLLHVLYSNFDLLRIIIVDDYVHVL